MNHCYRVDLTKSTSRFATKTKLIRTVWTYLAWPLVKYLPRTFGSSMRVLALRAFGAKIGKSCFIDSGVKVWIPWKLELADYVAIGREVEIYNYDWIRVGGMTVISQYCYLCTGSHDYTSTHFPLIWKPITIKSEVWVAACVFIAPGVEINEGAVIAAGAVVTRTVKPWSVYGGNPAAYIKQRELRDASDICLKTNAPGAV